MTNFKALDIWSKGFAIAIACAKLTITFPRHEKYCLTQQINKSAISIPSNIAEGSGRNSPKEFLHFLRIALASAFELETQLLIAQELNYTKSEILSPLLLQIVEEQKMVFSFGKTIESRIVRKR